MSLMTPFVNNNGTGRRALVEQRLAVAHHITAAMDAMRPSTPHGRDYIGIPDILEADRLIYTERFASLLDLHAELIAEALSINADN